MTAFNRKPICTTCGTQFASLQAPPVLCPICNDDRQYISEKGQNYTDLDELNKHYTVKVSKINEQLYEFKMVPDFAIGQRCFLVISPQGNILWDCIPLFNEELTTFIRSKGGIRAIAISHPHFYSSMNDWAETFGCPIMIHQHNERWIMYKTESVNLWKNNIQPLWDRLRIFNIGGHFPGSSVLHIPSKSSKGILLCGDTFYIARSKRHIAVMHSYPNQILLTRREFISVYERSKELEFDTMYGAFEGQNLQGDAMEIFQASMKRYCDSYEIHQGNI